MNPHKSIVTYIQTLVKKHSVSRQIEPGVQKKQIVNKQEFSKIGTSVRCINLFDSGNMRVKEYNGVL